MLKSLQLRLGTASPSKNIHLTVDVLKMEGKPVVSRVCKENSILQKKTKAAALVE